MADGRAFLERGHVIREVESREDLDRIRTLVCETAGCHLGISAGSAEDFLNSIHRHVTPATLNDLRLEVINAVNATDWVRPAYFRLARRTLESLVGNELSMQLRLNLSIQLPDDSSSLLPIHTDTWAGDSPFEAVVWLPLVDCFRTKSMFLLPPAACGDPARMLARAGASTSEELYRSVEKDLVWLDIKYGEVLVFNQNLPHGNRINRESQSRWSFNCRFKGVFTPYADKRLGEFFEPITLRPVSRVGMDYRISEDHETRNRGDRDGRL
jgi:sporadic carbohydrate cluster 2OG-Fe(II) oxygenase